MRAKKGFHCSLESNYSYSLDAVREALRYFSEELSQAAATAKLLRFDLSSDDQKYLMLFNDETNSLGMRLQMLFNDALDDIKMPYGVSIVLQVVSTPRFYCRIIRYDWFKLQRVKEG